VANIVDQLQPTVSITAMVPILYLGLFVINVAVPSFPAGISPTISLPCSLLLIVFCCYYRMTLYILTGMYYEMTTLVFIQASVSLLLAGTYWVVPQPMGLQPQDRPDLFVYMFRPRNRQKLSRQQCCQLCLHEHRERAGRKFSLFLRAAVVPGLQLSQSNRP
jgi:hypothetical protein